MCYLQVVRLRGRDSMALAIVDRIVTFWLFGNGGCLIMGVVVKE